MRNKGIQDERVLAQKQKIGSYACQILMIYLIGSVLVQQFVFQAPFKVYAVEFFGFFGISLYIVVYSLKQGHEVITKKNTHKTILVNSLITGLTIVVVSFVCNASSMQNVLEHKGAFLTSIGISFIVGTGCSYIAYSLLAWINRRREQAIEKQFDDEE